MQQALWKAHALRFLALVIVLFFNATSLTAEVKAVCADCMWLKRLLSEEQDEAATAARTTALVGLSEIDLKRAVNASAVWLKNPAAAEYDIAIQTIRTLVEGHPLWSCELTRQLQVSWPQPSRDPDLSTAKLSQLEVILDAKCVKTFSGSAFMARALRPDAPLSVRLAVLKGLSTVSYRPTFAELTALLRANQPEIRLLALDWMTRDQAQHAKNVLTFIKEAAASKIKQVRVSAYALLASLPEAQKAKYWSSEKKPLIYCQRLGDAEVRRACLDSLETP